MNENAPIQRKPASSLQELQAICSKSIHVELQFGGQPVCIEARRLTPAEESLLESMLLSVMPPCINGKTAEEDRYDFNSPDYMRRKMAVEVEARSLGLYWCVPVINQAKPGLRDPKEIVAFVQSQMHERILDALWEAIRQNPVTGAELVNFSSSNA